MYSGKLLLCCAQILLSPVENSLSAIEVFDDINVSAFPLVIPRFTVMWVIARDENDPDVECKASIYGHDEKPREFPFKASFQGQSRTRAILMLNGVAISRPGLVRVVCSTTGTGEAISAEYSFRVNAIPTVSADTKGFHGVTLGATSSHTNISS